jgi:hypothetical protein
VSTELPVPWFLILIHFCDRSFGLVLGAGSDAAVPPLHSVIQGSEQNAAGCTSLDGRANAAEVCVEAGNERPTWAECILLSD